MSDLSHNIGHLNQEYNIAKLYQINFFQLYNGIEIPILKTPKLVVYKYVPHSRLIFIWQFLVNIKATMTLSGTAVRAVPKGVVDAPLRSIKCRVITNSLHVFNIF